MSLPTWVTKRGASLEIPFTYTIDGVEVDLTSYTIACQVRDPETDALVATLTVTKSNQSTNTGEGTLTASKGDTLTWALKALHADFRFTDGAGLDNFSTTFAIQVGKAQTR